MSLSAGKCEEEETKLSDFALAARNQAASAAHTYTACEVYVRDRKFPAGSTRAPGYEPCDFMFETMIANDTLNIVYLLVADGMEPELDAWLVKLCAKENMKKIVLKFQNQAAQAEEGFNFGQIYPSTIMDTSAFECLVPFGKKGSNKLLFDSDCGDFHMEPKAIWTARGNEVTQWMQEHFATVKGVLFVDSDPFFTMANMNEYGDDDDVF